MAVREQSTEPNESQPTGSPALGLRFFGGFEARRGAHPLPRTRTRKEGWLLALLTFRPGQAVDRSWLAETLWPDTPEERALAYLRTSLYDLRRVLGPDAARLSAPTFRSVRLDLTGAEVDLLEFDQLIARGDSASLDRAVALYRGPLLEGCSEEWVLGERDGRQEQYLQALETLAGERTALGEPQEAARLLHRVLAVDPLRESTHRTLMEALARCGDYAAVDRQYRDLRHALLAEVNAEPAEETQALYRRLHAESRAPVSHRELPAPVLPRRRLPCPLSPLVGRQREVQEISALVRERRLVTLTGIGGIGKTRLAVAVAEALSAEFDDGVWFVDLAPLADPAAVLRRTAEVLGIREERDGALLEILCSVIGERRLLIVLDNCEHLVEACAGLAAALLGGCPHLRLLATSRQPLGPAGEVVWGVPGLEVPPSLRASEGEPGGEQAARLSCLRRCAAVELFTERARCANPRFNLTAESSDSVTQICRRLEGIPLALELAAAHTRSASPAEIAARLDDQYRLLTRGSPALPRHQTLRAAMDWSYRLLTEPERVLLHRLAVFTGGFSLAAVEAVCDAGMGDERLDLLTNLVDKSLVLYEEGPEPERAGGRYRLLEPVREYAREHLAQSGEEQTIRRLHRDHFLVLARELSRREGDLKHLDGMDPLSADQENLRAALAWSLEEEPVDGLELVLSLNWLWMWRSHLPEGCAWAERFLACGRDLPAELRCGAYVTLGVWTEWQGDLGAAEAWYRRGLAAADAGEYLFQSAQALCGLGAICSQQGHYDQAVAYLSESAARYRTIGNDQGSLRVRTELGAAYHHLGDDERASEVLEECLALARRIGDQPTTAMALDHLGDIALDHSDYASAQAFYTEKLAVARAHSLHELVIHALSDLGRVAWLTGDHQTADARVTEALAVAREVGSPVLQTFCLNHLARLAYGVRNLERLRALARESLELSWQAQEMSRVIPALRRLAGLAAALGEPARAVSLLATADRLEETHGPVRLFGEGELRADILALSRQALDEAAFLAATSAGAAAPLQGVVKDALRWAGSLPPAGGWESSG